MRRKSLIWKLFPIYFVITLVSVLVIGVYASEALREFYYSLAERDLRVRARLAMEDIAGAARSNDVARLRSLVGSAARAAQARVTVVDNSGKVVADSQADPSRMENHGDRPEVRAALSGRIGTARRMSPTLRFTTVYVAVPVMRGGRVVGVVRTAVSANELDARPNVIYLRILVVAVLVALLSGVVSFLAARRISSPLARVKEAAARFADGDFRQRVPLPDTEEFASLAETLNQMAAQLDRQLRTITEQTGEQQAILASMKEGVIAIDEEDRVLIVNAAAEDLLGARAESVKGRTIQEAVRNPDLLRVLQRSHNESEPVTEEIAFPGVRPRLVQATGTALVAADGRSLGVLAVLYDVTQTRKLESVRKDFVANVSHELRTPITSIKGFVETLRDGAITDSSQTRDFLDIIASQVDRLTAIIEDLLTLSRIEQETETSAIALEVAPIFGVLVAASANCETRAIENKAQVVVECDESLAAPINASLLEQAVTNLVDNAIRYSPGGSVRVVAEREGSDVAIHVIDTGVGIAEEHIPRLFERFYRVDRARSRKAGGTGLGLAIVKHIAQAHQGQVRVESAPGRGSKFSIILPASSS